MFVTMILVFALLFTAAGAVTLAYVHIHKEGYPLSDELLTTLYASIGFSGAGLLFYLVYFILRLAGV